jgi:hypothetical protein
MCWIGALGGGRAEHRRTRKQRNETIWFWCTYVLSFVPDSVNGLLVAGPRLIRGIIVLNGLKIGYIWAASRQLHNDRGGEESWNARKLAICLIVSRG